MIRAPNWCRNVVAAVTLTSGVMLTLSPAIGHAAPTAGKRAKTPTKEQARDPDDARLRAGIALLEARNYTRALAEFERAHATTTRPRALYWIARTNEESNHHANALRAYERYLREAGPEANTRDGMEVIGRAQMLTLRLALVTVSAPAGATIAIDDAPVGKAPLAGPIWVEPGTHSITADENDAQTIDLEPEGRAEIQFAAPERKTQVAPASPVLELGTATPAPRVEEKHATHSGGALEISGLTVSGILAATSVYFTVKAFGSASDFAQRKGELGASNAELEHLQGQTRLQAGVALGTGISALAALGLTLFVVRRSSQSDTRVGFTGSGLDISGKF